MARAFLSAGSNIDPADNMKKALALLCRYTEIRGISTVYLSPAEDRPEQAPYFNCVVEIETETPPLEFKYAVLRKIEESMGRKRTEDRSAARTIDLDLILYDGLIMNNGGLTLPDPQILRRAFIALPLSELSPELRLPGTGQAVAEIAAALPRERMTPLKEYTENLRKELFGHEQRKSRRPDPGIAERNR